jgi:bacterioferritin
MPPHDYDDDARRDAALMIAQDVKDEKKAMDMYKEIIDVARKENDETTAFLFMEILKEEEDHHDTFTTLLEQV